MKRYQNYKESCIGWISEIPEHWELWKISHAFPQIGSGTTPESGNPLYHKDGTISWLNTGDLNDGIIHSCSKKITERALEDYPSLKKFPTGSLVMAMYGATIGKTSIIKFETTTNQACCVFCESNIITQEFLQYWFIGNKEKIINLAIGGGQPNISQAILKDVRLYCPSIPEQGAIVNFLRIKISEIDTLILRKKKLISLLKEERAAIIHKAVTKGIDSDVKYKDSGIEWIGEIPEHWNVKRLRTISKEIKTGSTPPSDEAKYFTPEEIDWFGPGDFDSLVLKKAKRKISKLAISDKKCRLFPARTILLIGIGATVGKVGISLGACSSNQQINAIILKENFNPLFCMYYLSSIRELIINEASSATLPIFNQTQTKNLVLAIPSREEQTQIVSFIDTKTSEIDTIITKTEKEIALIKEYKNALINDVVTGKIDVSDEVEQSQNNLQEAHQ